jgi:soluble cytochrome b562
VDDPDKKNENLALVTELKKHLAGAQEEKPRKVQDLPDSDRASFLEAYRALLDEVIAKLDKLETAIKEDRPEAASALLKQLNDLKKKGHGKFQD